MSMENFDNAFKQQKDNSGVEKRELTEEERKEMLRQTRDEKSAILKKMYAKETTLVKKELAKYLGNPANANRFRTLSHTLEIVNTLIYSNKGNLIQDKTNKNKKIVVPATVGYRVKNISDKPIRLLTEKYAKDGTKNKGTVTVIEVKPNEVVNLSKKYFTINGVRPEFSGTFSNGSLVLRTNNNTYPLNDVLSRSSFVFNKALKKNVNDSGVVLQVGTGKNNEELKEEFVEDFGFVLNGEYSPVVKAKAKTVTDAEAKAFVVFKALQNNGNQF